MARGKIINDPVEYLKKKLEKLRREYNEAFTCTTRTHLQDKIDMYEKMLYGATCYEELSEWRRLNVRCINKTGMTLAGLMDNYGGNK